MRSSSLFSTSITAIIILIALPLLTMAHEPYATAAMVAICALALVLDMMARATASTDARPLYLSFTLYFSIFLLLPGIFHLNRGAFPYYFLSYDPTSATAACIMILVFVAMVLLGHTIGYLRARRVQSVPRALVLKAPVCFAFFCISLGIALLVAALLGFGTLTQRRVDTDFTGSTTLLLLIGGRVASFYSALLAFTVGAKLKKGRAGWFALGCFAACVAILLNFPLTTPRNVLFAYMIVSVFVLVDMRLRWSRLIFVVGMVAGIFTLFPAANAISRGDPSQAFNLNENIERYISSGDFDGLQSTINVLEMEEANGPAWGRQLLSAVLFFVPRPLWPDKSEATGVLAAEFAGYTFTNISAPLPSEFFADFSWIGVILGGLLVGIAIARFDQFAERMYRTGDFYGIILVGTVCGFSTIVLRGPLLGVIGPVVACVVYLGLFRVLCLGRPQIRNTTARLQIS